MTMPANIRVNAQVPFPATVQGSGPITISKTGGVWTVGFSVSQLGIQTPPVGNLATDYAFVWDSVAETFILVPLPPLAGGRASQILAGATLANPYNVETTDTAVLFNKTIGSASYALMPAAATMVFPIPVLFKDLKGDAGMNAITINFSAGELCDGEASVVLGNAYAWARIAPKIGGGGWYQC